MAVRHTYTSTSSAVSTCVVESFQFLITYFKKNLDLKHKSELIEAAETKAGKRIFFLFLTFRR